LRNFKKLMESNAKFCYDYPRPAVTTDCVIFSKLDEKLEVLLIQRAFEPYKNCWAFPGGFMEMDETAEECAQRELMEETGLKNISLEQFYTFSKVDRDPRGRTISIAFRAVVEKSEYLLKAGDDARKAEWFPIDKLPPLAFDHDQVFEIAYKGLNQTNSMCIM
jgi:8-oxo-dGTP diphosphatase